MIQVAYSHVAGELPFLVSQTVISAELLKEEGLDGNEDKLSGTPLHRLPRANKNHPYDGIDMSFIEEDIFAVKEEEEEIIEEPKKDEKSEDKEEEATPDEEKQPAVISAPAAATPKTMNWKKYRGFIKAQQIANSLTQLNREPVFTKEKTSSEEPTSYNEFLTRRIESTAGLTKERPPMSSDNDPVQGLIETPAPTPNCPDLEILQLQIDRVRELVGRRTRNEPTVEKNTGPVSRRRTAGCAIPESWAWDRNISLPQTAQTWPLDLSK